MEVVTTVITKITVPANIIVSFINSTVVINLLYAYLWNYVWCDSCQLCLFFIF